jgi:4-amino-4-deoxy-L-arabinose transferase-like glycosyltransferase
MGRMFTVTRQRVEDGLTRIHRQQWVQIGLLLIFCSILYFANLGQWDLWNPDEPRYAEVAREMVVNGDWILMHYNGNVYPDKPPLFFWLAGLLSYLWQGFTSFSVRLPAAFFGLLAVILTHLIGRIFFGSSVGLISGLILATSFEFAFRSTRANIDSTLTFFTTASMLCFVHWYRSRGPSIYGLYLGMALATLAKGPVGFLLPLLVCLAFLLVQKDWKAIKGMKLLPGILLMLALVLSWYVPAVLKGGSSYLQETIFKHSIARYSQGWAKVRPIDYYLYTFPMSFLPWAIFLPGAFIYGRLRETLEKRKEYLFLFIWFAVIFLFFSMSKGKRALYLLPLFPAAAILVGKLWHDLIFLSVDMIRRRWVFIPLCGLVTVSLLGGAATPWVVSWKAPSYFWHSLPVAFLLVGLSLAVFFMHRLRHDGKAFILIVVMVAAGLFYTQRVIFPAVNPYKSARLISEEITSRISTGDKVCVYGRVSAGSYNFYTGIVPIYDFYRPEDLFGFLKSSGKVLCLLTSKDYSQFQEMPDCPEMRLLARHQKGMNDVVLVSNQ